MTGSQIEFFIGNKDVLEYIYNLKKQMNARTIFF